MTFCNEMTSLLRHLAATSAALSLASCSCAIYHESWEARSGKSISNTSFHQAAKDSGFKSHRTSILGYKKRDVYFSYSNDGIINLNSSFCPNPMTLLTSGADVDAWNARCNSAEALVLDWYSKQGTSLKKASPGISSQQAEQGADVQLPARAESKAE